MRFLATLEVFYLAVVILRNRPPQQEQHYQRAPASEIQLFAAESIIKMMSKDLNLSLTFWPPIPYAVSLATSVAYQTLRNSVLPHHRQNAFALFNGSCEVLEEMSKGFPSARVISRLANNTVQEVERIAADRDKARRAKKTGQFLPGPRGTAHTTRTTSPAAATPEGGEALEASSNGSPLANVGSADEPSFDDSTLPFDTPSIFDDFLGGATIFNDFDSSLDLARIDQVFSANLDPTNPFPLQDWLGHF